MKPARHAVRVIRNGIYPAPAAAACTSTEVPHVEDGIPAAWHTGSGVLAFAQVAIYGINVGLETC